MGPYGKIDKAVAAIQRRVDIEARLANEANRVMADDERQYIYAHRLLHDLLREVRAIFDFENTY